MADIPRLPGFPAPRASQGPLERAAAVDLRQLHRQDAIILDASTLELLFKRLARAVDVCTAEGEWGRVGYLAPQMRATYFDLLGRGPDAGSDVDPFGVSTAVVDPTFG